MSYLKQEEQPLCWCERLCPAVQIFLLGGSWSGGQGGKNGEVFDPIAGKWRALTNVKPEFILTSDVTGTYRADNHGWFFGWLNGEGLLSSVLCVLECLALICRVAFLQTWLVHSLPQRCTTYHWCLCPSRCPGSHCQIGATYLPDIRRSHWPAKLSASCLTLTTLHAPTLPNTHRYVGTASAAQHGQRQ
jgi:hypothetical protein